jgi:NAD(P)-dependent dehydrogenase (short-subunit alcohol dehydrogenase family)
VSAPPDLASFALGLRALVFGAGGGIGAAFAAELGAHPRVAAVHAAARGAAAPWAFDLKDEASIEAVAKAAAVEGPLDLVLVATGVLHGPALRPEKTWRSLDAAALAEAFAINATGPALIAKHTLGLLRRDAKSAFACLSARVGSIEDNRLGGWHAYRASKAALNMLVRTCAVELRQRNPGALCVALHPGTVDTRLSQPFQGGVPSSKLFTPAMSARSLLGVLDRLTPADSGRLFAWDGQPIPF